MKKLDFLIIGAQKAGTTALDLYLREHHQVCMGNTKEIHFFDNEDNFKNDTINFNKYHSNFSPTLEHKVIGEATPIYLYWVDAIPRIWHYNKDIKLIILLRNPISRAYSHWNMEQQRDTDIISFSDAIREEETRVKEALPFKHRVYSYKDRGFYTEQLRRVFMFFNKSQVLILKSEALKANPKYSLRKITDFLNIEAFSDINKHTVHSKRYNENMSEKDFTFLKDTFFYEIKELEKLLSWDCSNWLKDDKSKKILFYRDFRGYSGGHQKVFDYFNHFKEKYKVYIAFSNHSVWDESNPWKSKYRDTIVNYNPQNYNLLFLAGMDWEILENDIEETMPVINFVQHIRHSYPSHPLYKYLTRKAIRICVSEEVSEAIKATGIVNGPIYTIENGHKLQNIISKKINDFYILGLKNPSLAKKLEKNLLNLKFKVVVSTKNIDRDNVFKNMASSKITILLPNFKEAEGFYLPALEAMKYSDLTIVPDCIGNRGFCKDKVNCLMPKYEKEDIITKALQAIEILNNNKLLQEYKKEAQKTLAKHNIESEKKALFKLLEELNFNV